MPRRRTEPSNKVKIFYLLFFVLEPSAENASERFGGARGCEATPGVVSLGSRRAIALASLNQTKRRKRRQKNLKEVK